MFKSKTRANLMAGITLALLLTAMTTTAHAARTVTVLCFGDSLTAGYGLSPTKSFPALLDAMLKKDGFNVRVVNAGLSGDTSAGGLARLDWSLKERPDVALLELGANDGLRGMPVDRMDANLETMINKLKAAKVRVLLLGMMAPRNMGQDYADKFDAVYPRLARRLDVDFYRFLLDGVAGHPDLNQVDGIHPNEKGAAIIARNLYPQVKRLVKIVAELPQ